MSNPVIYCGILDLFCIRFVEVSHKEEVLYLFVKFWFLARSTSTNDIYRKRLSMAADGWIFLRFLLAGWGRHSKDEGWSEVKASVIELLKDMHIPFSVRRDNPGLLSASHHVVCSWVNSLRFSETGGNLVQLALTQYERGGYKKAHGNHLNR